MLVAGLVCLGVCAAGIYFWSESKLPSEALAFSAVMGVAGAVMLVTGAMWSHAHYQAHRELSSETMGGDSFFEN